MAIGVDLFSRLGGDDRCPMRGSEATERGEGVGGGGGHPPPTVGTFSKIRVSKSHIRALTKRLSREVNVVKFHGEELIKELFLNKD